MTYKKFGLASKSASGLISRLVPAIHFTTFQSLTRGFSTRIQEVVGSINRVVAQRTNCASGYCG
jgi:hypothetical protein